MSRPYELEAEKKLDIEILDRIRELVYQRSGIKLDVSKESLIRARVGRRMRALGLLSHEEYLKHVIESNDEKEIIHLLNAISTNVTSFFRDADHFELLKILLKEWFTSGQKRFRIWSSACSSGEEPYSIAMTVLDSIGENADVKILATDISTRVLEKAQSCMYESEKVSQIPTDLKEKYLEKPNGNNGLYKIKPIARNMIVFKRLSLSKTPYPMQGPMDAVFCRNVMIYFDHDTRRRLLNEILRLLKPNGCLFVGHAEGLMGLTSDFRAIRPSVYLKEA